MIYIGLFTYVSHHEADQETDRRHGEFSLIISADGERAALDLFRERITVFRALSSMFEGECRIYLTRLLRMAEVPQEEALIFDYKSVAGDPVMPYIGCAVPSEISDGCEIVDWHEGIPAIEGREGHLFVSFPI